MPHKAKKNAQGAGTIRKRADGRWEARYTIGFDPATGKQKQRSIYGKTQREVREKLAEITVQIDQKTYEEPIKMCLDKWLDIWLAEYLGNTKPHTKRSYETVIENHIKPVLGKTQLQALTPVLVQHFVNHLQNQKDRDKRLNPKTVKNVHGVLHSALQQAVRIGYLKTNPASLTILPKCSKAEITPLQDEQVAQFLQVIKGHPFERIYLVDLFTGIRQSEILGLKWQDIDFEHGQITIRRQLQFVGRKYGGYRFTTPKNNKSRQIIPARFVMDVLKRQRIHQMEERLKAGPEWENKADLVFTDDFGRHLHPGRVRPCH